MVWYDLNWPNTSQQLGPNTRNDTTFSPIPIPRWHSPTVALRRAGWFAAALAQTSSDGSPGEMTWESWIFYGIYLGLYENRLNPYTQWFCWSLSVLNGYFIGGIPHFQTYLSYGIPSETCPEWIGWFSMQIDLHGLRTFEGTSKKNLGSLARCDHQPTGFVETAHL